MNDLEKMPPKCQNCPYWEWAEYPYFCDCGKRYENNDIPDHSQSKEKENVLIYHPMAVTDKGTQFVYDGMSTVSEALQQFEVWDNVYGYQIREAWIDEYKSGQKIKKLSVAKKWVLESEDA